MGQAISKVFNPIVKVYNPDVLDTQHVWGYHSIEDFKKKDERPFFKPSESRRLKKIIYFHNALNAGSIILSPIIGVIRIIVAIGALFDLSKKKPKPRPYNKKAAKRYFKMQIGRGVMELFFLGPILGTVVDGVMTCKHKEALCFSKA